MMRWTSSGLSPMRKSRVVLMDSRLSVTEVSYASVSASDLITLLGISGFY